MNKDSNREPYRVGGVYIDTTDLELPVEIDVRVLANLFRQLSRIAAAAAAAVGSWIFKL